MRPGFLLLEVLVGIAVFGIFLGAVALTLLKGQEDSVMGGDRGRATHAAVRALEASRSVRDTTFGSLTAGSHGIALSTTKTWVFSGSKVTVSGGYVTNVTVSTLAADWVRLTASTKWKHGYARSGSILIVSELTDWRGARATGDWSGLSLQGSDTPGGTPLFNDVAVRGNYAFLTSDTSGGGAGLYVYDISTLTAPTRVASSFSLGAAGYGLAIKGSTLYVVTGDASSELRAYDIASPTTFAAGNLRASFNLSGSSLATSLALDGGTLYVSANQDATYDEFYAFDVSSSGAIVYRDSLGHGANIVGIGVSGTGAYLATGDGAADMKAVDITQPSDLRFVTSGDYNVTCTQPPRSIATTGTSALLGCTKSASQELVLMDTRVPGGTPGPWYHEGSGSLVGVDLDGSDCYAFLAADSSVKAVQVVSAKNQALPELAVYNSTTGPGRGLYYDPVRDRLFVVTRSAFLIFQPSATPSSCS